MLVLLVGSLATARELSAQGRSPTFFATSALTGAVVDARGAAVLHRTIALDLSDVALPDALVAIARQGGIRLVYAQDLVPSGLRVTIQATHITLFAALSDVLQDIGVDVEVTSNAMLTLVRHGMMLTPARVPLPGASAARRDGVTISGRVTDSASRSPVPRAIVHLDGTSFTVVTRPDGRYVLADVPAGSYRLTVRRLGYTSRSVSVMVGDQPVTVDVVLTVSPVVLDEVVTTVTGAEQRREVGNLIETVRADSVVAMAPVTSVSDVLNARVPGLQVFQDGGVTGASPSINIRGQNSFTLSNQPLLYIDGVRVENSAADSPYFGTGVIAVTYGASFGGRLNDLNPEEIETIEVVKGPSAATLYGTDAANGVILITTKHGVAGPPRWEFSAEQGALTLDRDRFPFDYTAWGHAPGAPGPDTQCPLLSAAAGACVRDSVTHFSPLRDPATTMVKTSGRRQYAGQVSGGSDTRYFVSGSYEQEDAPLAMPAPDRAILAAERGATGLESDNVRPNSLTKSAARANLATELGSALDLSIAAAFISQENNIPSSDPWFYGEAGPGYRDANDGWAFGARPAEFFAARNREEVTHVTGSATSSWRPTGWLSAHATTGVDYSGDYADVLSRPGEFYTGSPGFRENGRTDITLYSVDVGATAAFIPLSVLSARTAVGGQFNRRQYLQNSAQATDLAPGTATVTGGAAPTVGESTLESTVAGAYVQEELGLAHRLFITGAVRADGASSFGRNFRTEYYPKASLSWLVSEEPWLPRIPGESSIRLRAAYGASGVQPGPVDALPSLQLAPAVVDGGTTTGAVLNTIGNPNLKPERQTEFEGGIDVDLFRQRAHIEATYYHKKSTDALVNIALPTYYGVAATTQEINIGSVRNQGVELAASVTVLDGPVIGWSLSASGSINQNALLSAPASLTTPGSGFAIGKPLSSNYSQPITHYGDANHDGIIEPNEVTVGATPAFDGASYPPAQATYQTTLTLLRGLQMNVQVDSRSGSQLTDYAAALSTAFGNSREVNDPHASLRDQAAAVAYNNFHYTSWGYTYNASFTRLREVSVTYAVPSSWLHAVRARSASITLAGRNLALWTRYRGVDPEVNTLPVANGLGGAYVDVGAAPPSQYWIARVRLGF